MNRRCESRLEAIPIHMVYRYELISLALPAYLAQAGKRDMRPCNDFPALRQPVQLLQPCFPGV